MNTTLAQLTEKVTTTIGTLIVARTWGESARLEFDNDVVVELDIYLDFYEVRITQGIRDIAWCDNIDEALECLNSYAAA